MAEPLLEVEGLEAGYGGAPVLRGVSLTVPVAKAVALVGANGAGKSTTLKTIAGLVRPTAGVIRWSGERIDGQLPSAVARRGLRLVPEGRRIFPTLTVKENLLVGGYLRWERVELRRRLEECLTLFPPLRDRLGQSGGILSGGEQQMLAMARALATDPSLLLLDEISMGLAPLIVSELYDLVGQLAAEGISILVVEQFARTALAIADYAAIMVHGRITRVGQPQDVTDEVSAAYLGSGA